MVKNSLKFRYAIGVLCILMIVGCTTTLDQQADNKPVVPTEEGVTRVISQDVVNVGDTVDVKLYINLGDNKSYYVAEEEVPAEFEVLDKDTDPNNHLKLINIQNPQDNIYEYNVRATEPGTFTFSGVYAFDGIDSPVPIIGDKVIIVR